MIDHVAHPSFDAAATHRFYADVLGAQLKVAFSGESSTWNARYLRQQVEAHAVDHWIEERDGEHLYVCDPNGLIIEFSVAEPPFAASPEALDVVHDWIATAQPA